MAKNKTVIILLGLTLVAFLLRWYLLPSHLFFGPEQGRDFLVIQNIVRGKLTLIGSKTDIEGIFHGPIYYYLAAIPFAISGGNPLIVSLFFVVIQSFTVFLVYQFAYELSRKRRVGFLAAIIFAISFLFIVYARWLSNPPLSIPLSLLFMLSLLRFVRGRSWYFVASAFLYGILGQTEFINFLLFGLIGLATCVWMGKRFLKTKPVVLFIACIVGFISSAASYILFDVRHNFLISNGVLTLLSGKSGVKVDIVTSTLGAFRVFFDQVSSSAGLLGWQWGSVIFLFIIIGLFSNIQKNKSEILLLFWLLIPPIIFAVLRHGMLEQLYAGIITGIIIALAFFIERFYTYSKVIAYFITGIFIITNFFAVFKNFPNNNNILFQRQQRGVRYSDQLTAIDWIYTRAQGKPFSFQSYTIPYFFQDAWTYLLEYYGQTKYGYLPDVYGRKLMYVIIQKDNIDPLFQKTWYQEATKSWGRVTDKKRIGDYTIEERTL